MMTRKGIVIFLFASLVFAVAHFAAAYPSLPDTQWLLWYDQPLPLDKWDNALPVGNGRLGAMLFGGVDRERIQLNEDTLWDGYPRDRINPEAIKALPEVRRLLFEGKNKEAQEKAQALMGVPERIKSYQSLGDLWIETLHAPNYQNYRRYLDLENGVAGISYQADGVAYSRTLFASVPHQVIVIHFTADQPGKISARFTLKRQQDFVCLSGAPDRLHLRGQITAIHHETGENVGMKYEARLQAFPKGGTVQSIGGVLTVEDADELIVLIAADTNYRGADPEKSCRQALEAVKSIPYEVLFDNSVSEHQSLFNRVDLDLGDSPNPDKPTDQRLAAIKQGADDPQFAALYFQYGRYLMMGSSRLGCMPANLQGLWNPYMDAPWSSDYHTNINLQMNYWIAEVGNLPECHLPLFDYMESLVDSGSRTAKEEYGCRGWVVHHLSDVWGFTTPADGIWGVWPVGAAWLCQHPYEHYLFTGDKNFLFYHGYPLMRGAARFLLDFLVEDPQGRLVTNPSHSPENSFRKGDGSRSMFTYGSTMDLEIIHDLFTNCVDASKILGVDEDFRAELESALKRLAPLQISSKTGRLQEWIEDYDEPEPGHRHMSHLFGLHPGHSITLRGTPDLAQAAHKSLDFRLSHGGGHTGWSRAWIVNFWARFEEAEKAYENLQALFAKCTNPNLFDMHPPFQIDGNFGGAAGIAEMLLQSHDGEISLLPALPKAWNTGSFRGLKARGAYTVAARWNEGRLVEADVSAAQEGTCKLRLSKSQAVEKIRSEDQDVPFENTKDPSVFEFQVLADKKYNVRVK
ncbi:MAG: glycoside hydrolase family 95 protein [Candidatus Omnitrophota bacterium]